VWRHFLHPEAKSLSPNCKPCGEYTTGLLGWRPIRAMFPFVYIGKEIERRAQEGEDISFAEDTRPRTYAPRQTRHTRPASADLIRRAGRFSIRKFMRESGVSQHSVERFLDGDPVHPATRAKLEQAIEKLERTLASDLKPTYPSA
jgi:hypothetical protein